jgi:hypothetical protein
MVSSRHGNENGEGNSRITETYVVIVVRRSNDMASPNEFRNCAPQKRILSDNRKSGLNEAGCANGLSVWS